MAYTFNPTQYGTVEIYQDGKRISTGTADYAATFGYNPSSNPTQSSSQTPAYTPDAMSGTQNAYQTKAPATLPPPDTSGYSDYYDAFIKQYEQAQKEQQSALDERNKTTDLISGIYEQLGGKAQRKTQLEAAAGRPELNKSAYDLVNQIKQNNLGAFAATQGQEDRLAPTFAIQGAQAQIERQRAVKNYGLAVALEAVNGNLALVDDNIQKALDAEFQPLEAKLEAQKFFYETNKDDLQRADKKAADALSMALDERTRMLTEQKENKNLIWQYIAAAAQNSGNTAPPSVINQAMKMTDPGQVLALLSPYFSDPTAAKQALANLELTRAQTLKAQKDAEGNTLLFGGLGNTTSNAYVNAFNSAVLGLPKASQELASKTFKNYVDNGDTEGARNYLISMVTQGLGVDQQKEISGRAQATASLQEIKSLLAQANATGHATNLLSGSLVNVAQKLGTTNDPALSYIGARIQTLLQTYRRAMTGVAFSEGETKEYQKIFPNISSVEELNTSKINALVDSFNTNNRATLAFYLGGEKNYNEIFGTPEGGNINNAYDNNTTLPGSSIFDSIVNGTQEDPLSNYEGAFSKFLQGFNNLFLGF